MMLKIILVIVGFLLINYSLLAQNYNFTQADSLRGQLNYMRKDWDVVFYDLNLTISINDSSIKGYNKIIISSKNNSDEIQIDLFSNFIVDSILFNSKKMDYQKIYNSLIVKTNYSKDRLYDTIIVYYHGKPRIAVKAPWDGGFVWNKDKNNNPWVGVACEGLGASSWWPLKDHLSDEPDSMRICISIPESLFCVSNGNLRSVKKDKINKGYCVYEWFVSYPINSYNVTLNIGDYAHIRDSFNGLNGNLDLDYYVLSYNKSKAKKHFRQVKDMLKCFEAELGPYPFYKDGYALVETSYWGMEHQGAIAYGNNYQNNEFGFDFIIVHESGHEWFGNNISCRDHAELWIHESFTTYTETILVECWHGKKKADEYILTQRPRIRNLDPILGPLDVNFDDWKSSDIYYKGAWMLHTLRHITNDDVLWKKTIRNMYDTFRLKIVTTDSIVKYFNRSLQKDYTYFFNQYLKNKNIPILRYKLEKKDNITYLLYYQWLADEPNFEMPLDVFINQKKQRIYPNKIKQVMELTISDPNQFKPDTDHFLIDVLKE
jgi:aminopeptidase N